MALPSLLYHFNINQLGFLHLLSLMSSDFLPQDELKHCSVLAPQPWLKKHRHRQATRLSTSSFLSLSTAKTPFLALVKYTGKWPTAPLSHSLYTCLRNKPGPQLFGCDSSWSIWREIRNHAFWTHIFSKENGSLGLRVHWRQNVVNRREQLSKAPKANRRTYAIGPEDDATCNLPPLCIFVEVKGPQNLYPPESCVQKIKTARKLRQIVARTGRLKRCASI